MVFFFLKSFLILIILRNEELFENVSKTKMLEIFVQINKKENDIFFGCNEIIDDAKFDMTSLNEIKEK